MMRWIGLGVFIAWLAIVPAQAQQSSGFTFNAATSLSVTGTSSNVAYPGSGSKLIVQNTGSNTAYLLQGNFSGTTATTASFPLTAGACIYLQATPGGYIAGITASSTTTVLVTQGEGDPPIYCGGSSGGGGGGGAVTLAAGSVSSGAYLAGSLVAGADVTEGTPSDVAVSGSTAGIGTIVAILKGIYNGIQALITAINSPVPVNVNSTATSQTGLTPGASSSSQTGTIIAANTDQSSVAGVALGVPANYGTSPGAVKVPGVNAFVTNPLGLNTTPTIANGNGVVPTQGGSVLSATNGAYTNLLQGNAALSATNGIYGNVLQGNAVLSAINPSFASVTDGTNKAAVKAANTAPTTSDPGLVANVNCSYTGSPCITLGGATPANSVPTVGAGFTYGNMTTATTTTFKSGAGVLHTITIGTLGTVASTISIFDNTAGSGTSIGVLNSLTTGEGTYTFDVAFATGLTLVTTGTVAPNVTVSYR